MRKKRVIGWVGIILAVFVLLLIITAPLLREPLRRYMEDSMNEALEGYSVDLGSVAVHPWSVSVTLGDLRIIQDAHPDPPVADIPHLNAGLHWRQALRARLVADFDIANPSLLFNLEQLREEIEDERTPDERGWQEALRAVYPFRVNMVTIRGGSLLYIDEDPDQPLHLEEIFFKAENIRNIESPDAVYPSSFRLESVIFGEGRLMVDGNADFLSETHPGVKARVDVTDIPLRPLRPVLSRFDLFVSDGEVAASGTIEHSPETRHYAFDTVEIRDLHIDYRYTEPTGEAETEEDPGDDPGEAVAALTGDPEEAPDEDEICYVIGDLRVTGRIGMVNTVTEPQFRLFLDPFDLRVSRLTNIYRLGETSAELTGAFMGSGETRASMRTIRTGPDFDLNLNIEDTHMPAMNDLILAYGDFDVKEGWFSLVMEIRVADEEISGYVEPFIRDVEVLDLDDDKDFTQHLYEGVLDVLTSLLENVPRDEVATRAFIEGDLDDPEVSLWQIVGNLLRNAFIEAIIPEFEDGAEE